MMSSKDFTERVQVLLREDIDADMLTYISDTLLTVLDESGFIWGTFQIDPQGRYILIGLDPDVTRSICNVVVTVLDEEREGNKNV